eukprot:UN1354
MLSHSTCDYEMDAAVQRRALKDGLLAMCLDLSLQASVTMGVYVAGYQGLDVLYQISAAGAAFPQYTALSGGLSYVVKVAGGAMVGDRMFVEFRTLMVAMVLCAAVVGAMSAYAVLAYRIELAGAYGVRTCAFASDSACFGVYAGLFGGSSGEPTILGTFTMLAVNASIFSLFNVARAGLYACQDFGFMALSAAVVLLTVFLPAILIARNVFDSAEAVYVASALPTWVLTVVFFIRLLQNSRDMLCGAKGPWLHSLEQDLSAGGLESTILPE